MTTKSLSLASLILGATAAPGLAFTGAVDQPASIQEQLAAIRTATAKLKAAVQKEPNAIPASSDGDAAAVEKAAAILVGFPQMEAQTAAVAELLRIFKATPEVKLQTRIVAICLVDTPKAHTVFTWSAHRTIEIAHLLYFQARTPDVKKAIVDGLKQLRPNWPIWADNELKAIKYIDD